MPQSDIHQPGSAGAIDRLTLTTAEVRGADSSMPGLCGCCLPPACGCFEAEASMLCACCCCFEGDSESS